MDAGEPESNRLKTKLDEMLLERELPRRAPQGDGFTERFIHTLKENLLWVQTFDTVEQLHLALLVFRGTYNIT